MVPPAGLEPALTRNEILSLARLPISPRGHSKNNISDKITKSKQKVTLHGILMVVPAGFEPATHCLEGSCSIQLSYGTYISYNNLYYSF